MCFYSNLRLEDKAFRDWCQDKDNVEAVNEALWNAYEAKANDANQETMTEMDAEIVEGG